MLWRFGKLYINENESNITDIMQQFASSLKKLLGNTLDSVIVYGSYARGNYSELSDIDVMILVTLTEEKIKKISDEISDMAFDYLMKFGVDISPVITNIDHFNYWADNLPYYRNVRDEGVILSA